MSRTYIYCCLGLYYLAMMFLSCKSIQSRKELNLEGSLVEKAVQQKKVHLKMEWANPLNTMALNTIATSGLLPPGNNGSQINLIGNTNYLKMKGDTLTGYLPFYGERRLGGGNGRDIQIEFNDKAKDLTIKRNEIKNRFEINGIISDKNRPTESYQVYTEIYANGKSRTTINSSDRTVISYIGTLQLDEQPRAVDLSN